MRPHLSIFDNWKKWTQKRACKYRVLFLAPAEKGDFAKNRQGESQGNLERGNFLASAGANKKAGETRGRNLTFQWLYGAPSSTVNRPLSLSPKFREGIEPSFLEYKTNVLPLNYRSKKSQWLDLNQRFPGPKPGGFPNSPTLRTATGLVSGLVPTTRQLLTVPASLGSSPQP